MARLETNEGERGSVLLLVLLLIALLSALALGVSLNVRAANSLQANHIDQIRARQLVYSGFVMSKVEVLNEGPYELNSSLKFELKTGDIEIQFFDEGGKIGLNSASKEVLTTLLKLTVSQEQADIMSSEIIDFRDANDIALNGLPERQVYREGLVSLVMKNRSFEMPSELCQFLPRQVCERLMPYVTVWNSQGGVDLTVSRQNLEASLGLEIGLFNTALSQYQTSSNRQNYKVKIDVITKGGSKLWSLGYVVD